MSKAWGVLVKLGIVRILCFQEREYSFDDESFSSKWVHKFLFSSSSHSLFLKLTENNPPFLQSSRNQVNSSSKD